MKKLFLTLVLALLVSPAFAAPNYVPTTFSGDQVIKTGPGIIIDGNIYYSGVTVGDKLVLRNGTSTSGAVVYTFIASCDKGSQQIPTYKRDIVVDQGIYLDETRTGGVLGIELYYQ
jgi:hypothetical protein